MNSILLVCDTVISQRNGSNIITNLLSSMKGMEFVLSLVCGDLRNGCALWKFVMLVTVTDVCYNVLVSSLLQICFQLKAVSSRH